MKGKALRKNSLHKICFNLCPIAVTYRRYRTNRAMVTTTRTPTITPTMIPTKDAVEPSVDESAETNHTIWYDLLM